MKITFESEELDQIYSFVKNINSKDANKVFNSLFTENHVEMIQLTANKKKLTLEVDKEISSIFLDVFIKNASNMASLTKSSKVSLLCNAKAVFDKLSKDIKNAVDIATKLWKRKKLLNEEYCKEYTRGCTDEL